MAAAEAAGSAGQVAFPAAGEHEQRRLVLAFVAGLQQAGQRATLARVAGVAALVDLVNGRRWFDWQSEPGTLRVTELGSRIPRAIMQLESAEQLQWLDGAMALPPGARLAQLIAAGPPGLGELLAALPLAAEDRFRTWLTVALILDDELRTLRALSRIEPGDELRAKEWRGLTSRLNRRDQIVAWFLLQKFGFAGYRPAAGGKEHYHD